MLKDKVYTDEDIVILIYRIENRIVKEKNRLGKIRAKAKDLQDQGIETSIFDARMEPMINQILKDAGATREKLQ
jgi:hypothetical protein